MGAYFKTTKLLIMDTLQKAIKLLKEAKKQENLKIFTYLNDSDVLKFIAEQAQGIMGNGEIAKPIKGQTEYNCTIRAFGEPLVNAAIELYNS